LRYFIILLSLVTFAVCGEYDYDFEETTNADGVYAWEGDFEGYNVKIRKIQLVDFDASNVVITNGKGVEFWNGPLKAGVVQNTQNSNTKTKYVTMKFTGKSNTSFKFKMVVEWKWGWIQKPLAMNLSVRSNDNTVKIGAVRPGNEKMDAVAEALIGDDKNTHTVKFNHKTDDNGCLETEAQNISPKSANPQISVILVDHSFKNIELSINDEIFRPEFSLKLNGQYFYKLNLPIQNNEGIKLAITAQGGKPVSATNFVIIYKD